MAISSKIMSIYETKTSNEVASISVQMLPKTGSKNAQQASKRARNRSQDQNQDNTLKI